MLRGFANFLAEHLAATRGEAKLLSPDFYEWLHAPAPGADYAMGWRTSPLDAMLGEDLGPKVGARVLWHTGSNGYWLAGAFIFPERDFAVLVVSNGGGRDASRERFAPSA